MILPIEVEITPEDKIVKSSEIGDEGYAENVVYTLQINMMRGSVEIAYYGENDTYLDENILEKIIKLINVK
jgi:hypothetical protein|tara:strand:+ start:422 stop:634 length:213 start_codon:yes stop_codon:yes gene_type:complete